MKRHIYLYLILLSFTKLLVAQIPASEKTALQTVYNALNGPNWDSQNDANTADDWDFSQPVTNAWYGVTISNIAGQDHITKLELSSFNSPGQNNVIGTLPDEIGNFPMLTKLHIEYTDLTGTTLQPAIGNLANLEQLYMSNCNLNGNIPNNFSNLTSLKLFRAYTNNFYFPLAAAIGGMTALEHLSLDWNGFTAIPT